MSAAMEVAMTNYTPSKFAADNALTDVDVVEKYKLSANIVNGKKKKKK